VILPLHSGVLYRPLPLCSHQYMAVKKGPRQQPPLHIAQAAPIPPTPAAAVHSCRTHRAVALGRHTCAAPYALFVELSLPPKPRRSTYRSGDAAGRAGLAGASRPPQVNVAKSPRRIVVPPPTGSRRRSSPDTTTAAAAAAAEAWKGRRRRTGPRCGSYG